MFQRLIISTLGIFDYFYQKKIIKFLRSINKNNFELVIDVGAHKGETINLFLNNFKIKKIISFEPSSITYEQLNIKIKKLKKNFKKTEIITENLGLGSETKKMKIKHMKETSSSTINDLNTNSLYFKRKFKLLNFFGVDALYKNLVIQVVKLSQYMKKHEINKIDFLKIDTEGYEFEVLKGLEESVHKVNIIMLEHHFDNMISKSYKYSDISHFMKSCNFKLVYKSKMPFRKTFEYIFINNIQN